MLYCESFLTTIGSIRDSKELVSVEFVNKIHNRFLVWLWCQGWKQFDKSLNDGYVRGEWRARVVVNDQCGHLFEIWLPQASVSSWICK